MMPRPTIPTLPFAIASLRCRSMRRRTLHGGRRRVQAQCGRAVRREGCLFRARIIPYGRRPLPQRCGSAGGKPTRRAHPMQIGIAGIGKMGAAIAQRLMEVGHKVTAWNRSADKLKPLTAAGAAVAATPAELARNADAVITVPTDAAAIDAVYTGASGLLAPD